MKQAARVNSIAEVKYMKFSEINYFLFWQRDCAADDQKGEEETSLWENFGFFIPEYVVSVYCWVFSNYWNGFL